MSSDGAAHDGAAHDRAASDRAAPSPDSFRPRVVGGGMLAGVAVAWVVAAIAALQSDDPTRVWLVRGGLLAMFLAPALAGAGLVRASTLRTVVVGLGLALGPVAVVGRVLKVATHHRPLGAATFAVLALGALIGGVWLTARARSSHRFAERAVYAAAALSVAFVTWQAVRTPSAIGGLLELTVLLGLSALCLVLAVPERLAKLPAWIGPSLWIITSVLGTVVGIEGRH